MGVAWCAELILLVAGRNKAKKVNLDINLSLAEENGYREILGAIDYARESDRLYEANTLRKRPGGFPGSGKISPPTLGKRKYPRERRMMI